MSRENLLRDIAPCGLVCYSCASFEAGPIAEHARELAHWLEGFEPFAAAFSAFQPRLAAYPAFRDVLDLLAHGPCSGCRDGRGCMPGCVVRACTAERGYAFCAECPEFPCTRADFEGQLREAWLWANQRMREIGQEAFWAEMRTRGHYAHGA